MTRKIIVHISYCYLLLIILAGDITLDEPLASNDERGLVYIYDLKCFSQM